MEGLKAQELKTFDDLLIKANDIQVRHMADRAMMESFKREKRRVEAIQNGKKEKIKAKIEF